MGAFGDNTAQIFEAAVNNVTAIFSGHQGQVRDASYSPDGLRVVTASYDKTARIWDVKSQKTITILKGHTDTLASAAFSPDGRRVVTASRDETVRIWDSASGDLIRVLKHDENGIIPAHAEFHPNGKLLIGIEYLAERIADKHGHRG